jgi:hypothetical protein
VLVLEVVTRNETTQFGVYNPTQPTPVVRYIAGFQVRHDPLSHDIDGLCYMFHRRKATGWPAIDVLDSSDSD